MTFHVERIDHVVLRVCDLVAWSPGGGEDRSIAAKDDGGEVNISTSRISIRVEKILRQDEIDLEKNFRSTTPTPRAGRKRDSS
jgi:hypothetical protein